MSVTELEVIKQRRFDNEPHFNVWALCLDCKERWIGTVHYKTSLFTLDCPKCGASKSFASVIPDEYLAAHNLDDDTIRASLE